MFLFFDCSRIPRWVEILIFALTTRILSLFRFFLEHSLFFFLSYLSLELQPLFLLLFEEGLESLSLLLVLLLNNLLALVLLLEVLVLVKECAMLIHIHLTFYEKVLFYSFHSIYLLVLFSKEVSIVIILDAGNRSDFLSSHSFLLLAYVSRGFRRHQLIDLGYLLGKNVWNSFHLTSIVVCCINPPLIYCFKSRIYLRFFCNGFQWLCHEAWVQLGYKLLRSGLILILELAHASLEGLSQGTIGVCLAILSDFTILFFHLIIIVLLQNAAF